MYKLLNSLYIYIYIYIYIYTLKNVMEQNLRSSGFRITNPSSK